MKEVYILDLKKVFEYFHPDTETILWGFCNKSDLSLSQ